MIDFMDKFRLFGRVDRARLRHTASALTLAMLMTTAPGLVATAKAEPSVQQVLDTLGPIAGADGLVTETELRGWIGYLVANDPDPDATPPTSAQIDGLIASIPSSIDGSGTRIFSLETIVLMTAQQQLAENGGAWDGNSEPTLTQAAVIAQQAAGADGILTEAEFRAWAASLTGSFQVSDADIDRVVADINAAGGTFSIVSLLTHISSDGGDNGTDQGNGNGDGTVDTSSSSNGDSGRLTSAEIAIALRALAGPDRSVSREEFQAFVAAWPERDRAPPEIVDRFLGTLTPNASGQFDVETTIHELTHWNDDPDGSGGPGTGPNGQGAPNASPVCVAINMTFNGDACFQTYTGQVSISATGPGTELFQHNETPIETTGEHQPGIVLQIWPHNGSFDYAHPAMIVDNVASITTTGEGSDGISAWRGGNGSIRIGNTGDITATGEMSNGIRVATSAPYGVYGVGPGGDITIVNTGNIRAGEWGAGIAAFSGDSVYFGNGSVVQGGDISISNTGVIESRGWAGIVAATAGGDIFVTNSGAIDVVVPVSYSGVANPHGVWGAIAVQTPGGSASVTNTGNISVSGTGAGGIAVEADESWTDERPTQTATINNSGNINLIGEEQNGLEAYAFNGQATVVNSGQISSSQYWATGISVDAGTEDSTTSAATVQHAGVIDLSGDRSNGIQATTPLGTVNVQNRGTVRATGADSIGIFTVGVFGGSALVNNDGGTIVGGTGATTFASQSASGEGDGTAFTGSAGILMLGSDINTIYNTGTITSLNGQAIATFEGALTVYEWDDEQQQEVPFVLDIPVADTTIHNRAGGLIDGNVRLGSGDDSIFNSGRITGDIDMAGGANLIENAASGILTGSSIHVGAGNTLTNAGTISPGGTGVISETIVVGNFVQTSTGRMVIDINETAGVRNDAINVSGTATLAGTVTPNVIDLNEVVQSEYRILTSQGLTDNGIVANPAEVQVTDTIGYDFSLEQRANDLYLLAEQQRTASQIAAEAAASGAGGAGAQNLASLGGALESLEQSDDESSKVVLNAIRLQDGPASAAKVMDRIIPQQQGGTAGSASRSGASFGNAMLSCATRDGEYAYTREGKCYYAKLTVRRLDHDASSGSAGVRETGTEAMGGIQFDIGGERRLGLAFGYEDIDAKAFSTAQSLGSSEGQRFQGGLVFKDQWGPFNAYLNLTGNYTDLDNKRFVNLGGFTNAQSEQEVMSGLIKLRLSYLRDMGPWYVKPLVDVGASYIHLGGYTETGAGGFNLTVASADKWLFSVMPGLEIGGEMRDGGGTIWRPYIRAGVTLYNDDGLSINARFADAAAAASGFNVATQLDTVYADIDTGMHVLTASGLNLRFNYEGRFGESTRQHAGTVKLSVPY
jgi:hypothetical protein